MPDLAPDRAALLALLEFHVAAGVDCALDETPHDRFADDAARPAAQAFAEATVARGAAAGTSDAAQRTQPHPLLQRAPEPRMPARPAVVAPEEAATAARDQARTARSLEELEALLASFEGCGLRVTAKNLVFADGNPQSRLMFVGEAPGGDEDRIGKPFVGRSGQLLDRMLAAVGLDRTSVYIANIVPWRPPGNRTPTPQEVAICRPFIEKQIELADPDILVCLGGPSAQTLLNIKDGILKTRGRWFPFHTGRREIRAFATLHPAYLLRQPLQKRLAWRDFRALKRALEGSM
ncbi:MAG TPA: uracil-DNA glycosylase [Beijerinckiaceae bacterium]|nr:uracil-DNA glycosylase [Beijerinckiaceae bacterium]